MLATSMRRRLLLAAVALLLTPGLAAGSVSSMGAGAWAVASSGGGPYTAGPGDVLSGAAVYVGLRAYTAAIATAHTQPLVNLRRASDSHQCDVLVATNGGLGVTSSCGTGGDNGQSATSFCASTTCYATKLYDQSGNSRDQSQATTTAQPQLVFSCLGAKPCLSGDGTKWLSGADGLTAFTFSFSITESRTSIVAWETLLNFQTAATGGGCGYGNNYTGDTDQYWSCGTLFGVSVFPGGTAWHIIGVLNDTPNATAIVDGVVNDIATSGTNTPATTMGELGYSDAGSWSGEFTELIVYTSNINSSNMAALCHNSYAYYGTSVAC